MRVLVCDDESLYLDAISASIQRWRMQRKVNGIIVSTYRSSEDLLEVLERALPFDLAFLDIQFPGELSGLALAESLRKTNEQVLIVFTTHYEKYAMEGYKVNALRYLQKPVSDTQIFECLDIAYRQWKLCCDRYLTLIDSQQVCRIAYKSILYIESQAHYVDIHLAHRDETPRFRMKLLEVLNKLPEEMFAQCHRSFAINLLYVQRISRKSIVLSDGATVPVSARFWENVLLRFKTLFQGASNEHFLEPLRNWDQLL